MVEIVKATHWACGVYHCSACADEYWHDAKSIAECGFYRRGKWVPYALDHTRHCYTCCPCSECEHTRKIQRENDADPHLAWRRAKREWLQNGDGMNLFGQLLEVVVALHQNQPPVEYPQLRTNLEEMAFQADEKPGRARLDDIGKPSTQQAAASVIGAAATAATQQDPEDLKQFFRVLGCYDD